MRRPSHLSLLTTAAAFSLLLACGSDPVEGPGINAKTDDGGATDGNVNPDAQISEDGGGQVLKDSGGGGGICGDKKCDAPAEDKNNCPIDCNDAPGKILACMKLACGVFHTECGADKSCNLFLQCAEGCADETCVHKCENTVPADPTQKLKRLLFCGAEKGCLEQGPAPVCGDGKCESGENPFGCPEDCAGVKPVCGNGKCETGETSETCPKDCGGVKPFCGNGMCEAGESPSNCAKDCGEPGGAMACAAKLCAKDYEMCVTHPGCGELIKCMSPCNDSTCFEKCIGAAGGNALEVFMPLATCAKDKGCGQEPTCGNGNCEPGESYENCPQDCKPKPPVCGNKVCEDGESAQTCPFDCGDVKPVCGNGKCEMPYESPQTCPKDCGDVKPVCGNGQCQQPYETPDNCPEDCGQIKPVCGNGKCEVPYENEKSCPKDCQGIPPVWCGNGQCEPGETQQNCPKDCGSATVCGNGKCEPGESLMNCPKDCGGSELLGCVKDKCTDAYKKCVSDAGCAKVTDCVAKCTNTNCMVACIYQAPAKTQQLFMPVAQCAQDKGCIGGGPGPVCGNGQCEQGETKNNCPKDCGAPPVNPIACSKEKCPKQYQQCLSVQSCAKVVDCMLQCSSDACFEKCASMGGGAQFSALVQCAVTSGCIDGGPQPVCGDGQCSDGEQFSCPKDCMGPGPVCGNGQCEGPMENSMNCPADCGGGNGSCQNKCGGQSNGCYCDNICKQQGDCCNDYDQYCGGTSAGSCQNMCGKASDKCSCLPDCAAKGNCCPDFKKFCPMPPSYCGDGLCQPPMEDEKNCPKDCSSQVKTCKSKKDCSATEVCCGTSKGQICVPSGQCG